MIGIWRKDMLRMFFLVKIAKDYVHEPTIRVWRQGLFSMSMYIKENHMWLEIGSKRFFSKIEYEFNWAFVVNAKSDTLMFIQHTRDQ